MIPAIKASLLFSIESFPKVGPICFSEIISTGIGSAPAFNLIIRLLTSVGVKSPDICAFPPEIAWFTLGAEIIRLSSSMANGYFWIHSITI